MDKNFDYNITASSTRAKFNDCVAESAGYWAQFIDNKKNFKQKCCPGVMNKVHCMCL